MSLFKNVRHRISVEGVMPERALLRLKRAGIVLYSVKKTEKTRLCFSVRKKDLGKVFAVFPQNGFQDGYTRTYRVKDLGAVGIGGKMEKLVSRTGLLLGALLFAAITLYADKFVFSLEFMGTNVYARETQIVLEQAGIKMFAPYRKGKEDWICSQILALKGVEYCSVKKEGTKLVIETRLSPFASEYAQEGQMQSKYRGEIVAFTVLRGTALVKIGDMVEAGQTLADNHFSVEEGEQVRVQIIARARISCVWEGRVDAKTEEEAFAIAYLAIGENTEIYHREIVNEGNGYAVKIVYIATQSMNF